MPFMCLPDGAHAAEEEFIYFHLPPIPSWPAEYSNTLFGLACFRQIDSKDLLHRPADVTRTKVQKSVVVIASQCLLGSVRSKLGLVTQAFFAQRDFTKLEIIDNLFTNLNTTIRYPISDATLFMGVSLRELVFTFKAKTLQLFKLLLLGKRVLFFGHKVERLSAYQYGLISMVPELLRNLQDVGSPELPNIPVVAPQRVSLSLQNTHRSMDNLRSHHLDTHKMKLFKLGHPLRIFGEYSFFQPYIPLQQMDVLESSKTKSFLAGTSNSIFTHHKTCAIDVVAHADTGNLEVINPAINALIALSAADKKFIEDIIKPVSLNWKPDNDMSQIQEINFEGSDDDIRARFESYVTQLFASMEYDINTPPIEAGQKKIDYLSEFNLVWVKAWKSSPSYAIWEQGHDSEYVGMINPGHPCHGYSALNEISTSIAASFSALGRGITLRTQPAATPEVLEEQPADSVTATQLMQNVSSWYTLKKNQWTGSNPPPPISPRVEAVNQADIAKELERIQELVASSKVQEKEPDFEQVDL
ncbi:transport protein Avl9-domain-containing protein [Globomyces pollinis-pini]|nr:transport protein Avl9-domain-containing protein [Globomyces pollinis-pini]